MFAAAAFAMQAQPVASEVALVATSDGAQVASVVSPAFVHKLLPALSIENALLIEWGVWWSIAIVTIFASALFSGVEVGCYSINRVRLDLRAARTPPDKQAVTLRSELEQPERLIATLLISNNVVNALSAWATSKLLEQSGQSTTVIAIFNTLVLAPLLFVAGEALPKEAFRQDADILTPKLAAPLRAVRVLLTITGVLPFIRLCATAAEKLMRLPREAGADPRQRISMLLQEGAGHGVLSESQASMVDRALAFRTVTVGDEMTSWSKVLVLPAQAERSRMLELIGASTHAAYPCVDRMGRVVGVVAHMDLYTHTRKSTAELQRSPLRVTTTTIAREALAKLRSTGNRIAIVEDANGKVVGVVTARDLIEPLTGELPGW
jgi:CBS domain containing-hemolysin-like protein